MSEINPIVIADDNQIAFWTPYNGEVGNHRIDIVNDTDVKQVGTDSLKLTLGLGTFGLVGVYREFGSPQDWSSKDVVAFDWYGANSGYNWKLGLICAGWASSFNFNFDDNWIGWRRIVIPMASMVPVGAPSWSSIVYIQVFAVGLPTTPTQTTVTNLDRLILDVSAAINYTLTMLVPSGQGTVTPPAGSTVYPSGSVVALLAIPMQGWIFDHWTLNGASVTGGAAASVIMDADKTLQAYFTQIISGRQVLHFCQAVGPSDTWDDKTTINVRNQINHFNALVGKSIYGYTNWIAEWGNTFGWMLGSGDHGLLTLLQDGTLKALCVNWMPYYNATDQLTLKNIVAGTEDAHIITIANECKAFGYPLYIRFGGEFNLATTVGKWAANPSDFVGAWRRIVDLFRAQGVTNILWVWNPNFAGDTSIHNWFPYYPGDNYVDWLGIDMYQFSDSYSYGADPELEMSYFYNDYGGGSKPIGIFEWGVNSVEWTGQNTPDALRAKWLSDFFDAVERRPNIKLISYFYRGTPFMFDDQPLTLTTYQQRIANPIYVGNEAPPIPSHVLVVTTVPIIGVPIVLNGQNYITPTPPITLPEGSHSVSCPSNVIVGTDTYNFSQWENGSTNPQRMFPLTADATIMASYVLVQPPPAKGSIEVHAFLESTEIVASGVVVETGQTFQTPTTIIVDPNTYLVRVTNGTQVKEQWAVVTQDQTIRLDFQFQPPAPISPLSKVLPVLAPILIGGVSLSIRRRG